MPLGEGSRLDCPANEGIAVNRLRFHVAVGLLSVLGACSGVTPYTVVATGPAAAAADTTGYRLSPDDKVKVTVFNEDTLTGEYVVRDDSSISFPLVGAVKAAGLTAEELGREIAGKLAEGYLSNPKVAVEVQSFKPVYVLGEVNHAGKFDFVDHMTVLQAIASAEGFSYRANKRIVLIKHADSAAEVPTQITPTLRVLPGDTIRVAERYF